MAKVTGIGGVFFKTRNRDALMKWYADHFGIPPAHEGSFMLPQTEGNYSVLGLFTADTTYFGPSRNAFMINLQVDDLDGMVRQLRTAGIVPEPIQDYDYGRFTWVMDPEGNRVELWAQPLKRARRSRAAKPKGRPRKAPKRKQAKRLRRR